MNLQESELQTNSTNLENNDSSDLAKQNKQGEYCKQTSNLYTRHTEKVQYVSSDKIEKFLQDEQTGSKKEPWSRLQQNIKHDMLNEYALSYCELHDLHENISSLQSFLRLDAYKRLKGKEIIYNKDDCVIEKIPGLYFNQETSTFHIRRNETRVSTSRSLPPKREKSASRKKRSDNK